MVCVPRRLATAAPVEGPPTPGPDDVAISAELARIHARAGADPGGPDLVTGGLIHVMGPGETLQTVAAEYHVPAQVILDGLPERAGAGPGEAADECFVDVGEPGVREVIPQVVEIGLRR